MKQLSSIIVSFILTFSSIKAVVRDVVESIKTIQVKSASQKVLNKNEAFFEGDVQIMIDEFAHIWADTVDISKDSKIVRARAKPQGYVMLETSDLLILADYVELDLYKRTGFVKNLKVHLDGRLISAKYAEKISDSIWEFKDVKYSACDRVHPHWHFTAKRAGLKNYVISASGIWFHIAGLPVFMLPSFGVPGQSQSKSGFLIPKFSLGNLGLGIRQEFFCDIAKHFDTTIGLNWKQKQGVVLYDEFRHATGPEEYTLVNSKYAIERRAEVEKGGRIVKSWARRNFVTGKHFHTLKINDLRVNDLAKFEFGTDKRVGYEFLGKTDAIEDLFQNSWISRVQNDKSLLSLSFSREKLFREQFTFPNEVKNETEERFEVIKAPRLEGNFVNNKFCKLFHYKHDFFADYLYLDRQKLQKQYLDRKITSSTILIPHNYSDTARIYYQGDLWEDIKVRRSRLFFHFISNLQARSSLQDSSVSPITKNAFEARLFSGGVARFFPSFEAELALPQYATDSKQFFARKYIQSFVRWKFIPKFDQRHWIFADEWDRVFPKNELVFSTIGDFEWKDFNMGFAIHSGYDFYSQVDMMPLRRSLLNNHLLPVKVSSYFDANAFRVSILQEYDIKALTTLTSIIDLGFSYKDSALNVGLLYQEPRVLKNRELLSDIPSFALIGVRLPLYRNVILYYNTHLYSPKNSVIGLLKHLNSLYNRATLEYRGHCWSATLGFEEKRYRQQGIMKSERVYALSVKLDSLGSFSHQFRKEPILLSAPQDY